MSSHSTSAPPATKIVSPCAPKNNRPASGSSIFYAPCEGYLPLPLIHSLVCVIKTARPAAGRHMRAQDSPKSSTSSTAPIIRQKASELKLAPHSKSMPDLRQMKSGSSVSPKSKIHPRPPSSVPMKRPGTASIARFSVMSSKTGQLPYLLTSTSRTTHRCCTFRIQSVQMPDCSSSKLLTGGVLERTTLEGAEATSQDVLRVWIRSVISLQLKLLLKM